MASEVSVLPDSFGDRPKKLLHGGRAFGLLSAIEKSEDCIITTIGRRKVVLPEEMQARLEPFLHKRIGLARIDDDYGLLELS